MLFFVIETNVSLKMRIDQFFLESHVLKSTDSARCQLKLKETSFIYTVRKNILLFIRKPMRLWVKLLIALCLLVILLICVLVPVLVVYLGTTTMTSTTATTTTATTTTTTQGVTVRSAFWLFDGNCLELLNSFDGVASGSPTYTTSFLGYGNSISLTASSSQYVSISSPQILLSTSSFTIEAWIYPISLTTADFGIFGQCQSASTNLCFHFVIRQVKLYCGFYSNDVTGGTTLTLNRWSHVACLYDHSTGTQQVWLNGVLDGTRTSVTAYQSSSGITTIGMVSYPMPLNYYFNGYIDQVRFEPRAKSSWELLYDATLSAYYSFDSSSLLDGGPNGINLTLSGSVTTITGRINTAIQFSSGSYLYSNFSSFYFLGVSSYSASISLWIKPMGSYASSTIMHVTSGWCVGFITMTSNGNIMANSWNGAGITAAGPVLSLNTWHHIGYTYSSSNGLRLYINGTQYSSSGSFSFSASGLLSQIALGGNLGQNSCSPGYGGTFTGAIDEYYLYSRELTAAEIAALANP